MEFELVKVLLAAFTRRHSSPKLLSLSLSECVIASGLHEAGGGRSDHTGECVIAKPRTAEIHAGRACAVVVIVDRLLAVTMYLLVDLRGRSFDAKQDMSRDRAQETCKLSFV